MSNQSERFVLQVYVGAFSKLYEALSIEASKTTLADEIVDCISDKLGLKESSCYELAEVMGNDGGQDCKERRIGPHECPVALQLLWPKKSKDSLLGKDSSSSLSTNTSSGPDYRFCLRRKLMQCMNWSFSWTDSTDSQLIRDYFLRFLYQPRDREYPDLCQLPDLTEQTLLENLKARFDKGHIYTYVGSILIAVNPFKFYPIYNPKYVQLYQNRRLGELPPHIFAIADASYQAMLRNRCNQCIVISGESGSGKTESTNLLLHHLTALSQKGTHGSGVEQTILGAGPVLEAFGNAKTKHNNNSSRFGKFIQVNYKENGMVHGALVQKYLLEKSRIVSQVKSERNYHVFYYLLAGANQSDKESLHLGKPQDYNYLNQSKCYTLDGVDESYEFSRLTQSMELVGFSQHKQHLVFRVLSAVLHLGNIEFQKKSTYHTDETVQIKNNDILSIISKLLLVKEETLQLALTCKKTKAAKGETLVINYKHQDAIATRDAMAKCLYGALFDWIVMQVNHALLAKKDYREHKGHYIGVLDIFGFEDFGDQNNFEQFCINFANEHLQFYFNQHVFKYEQEEYKKEGINWKNIDFIDNIDCLTLVEGRPHGLLCLLDDQCNFPGASNETVFQKFVNHHGNGQSQLFEVPPCRQSAFVIKHYAGKVKYQIRDFREKNLDLMRPDIVSVLKSSQLAFVRELVGADPLAIFRWQILKAFFKAYFIFSKLREISKMKRGLNDKFVINEINNRRRSLNETKKLSMPSDSSSHSSPSLTLSSLSSSRISKAILSKQALFGAITNDDNKNNNLQVHNSQSNVPRSNGPSPQCVRGSLLKTTSDHLHGISPNLCSNDAKVLFQANKILMKSKSAQLQRSLKPIKGIEKSIKNLQTLKQLTNTGTTGLIATSSVAGGQHHPKSLTMNRTGHRKPTPTVTAQFQQSLQQLMETLNQANPFFVRCIKSNADKISNHFDDMLVLLQLRYTGMLETVRIRQSGYSVRLTFEEFIQHYRTLLPKGLLSSQNDVRNFLCLMNLNKDNYQIGKSKIFMRESEKLVLDERLHQEILRKIISLQRWVRTWLLRRRFVEMREAAIIIQSYTRRWMAQRRLSELKRIANFENWAAATIQKTWRGYQAKKLFNRLKQTTIVFQAYCRGHLLRNQLAMRTKEKEQLKKSSDSQSSYSDEAFLSFLSKGSSQEELEYDHQEYDQRKSTEKQHHFYHHNLASQIIHQIPFNQTSKQTSNKENQSEESSSGIHEDDSEDNELSKKPLVPRPSSQRLSKPDINDSPVQSNKNDETFNDEDDGKVRLDRRRNKPLRKLSLKKARSSKNQDILSASIPSASSFEYPKTESPATPSDTKSPQLKSLTKLNSDSLIAPPKIKLQETFSNDKPNQLKLSEPTVGALQKAKKTFKNFIGIERDFRDKKSFDFKDKKSSKKEPQMITLSYDSGPEDVSLLCSSQKSSKMKNQRRNSGSSNAPIAKPTSKDAANFTLLTRHNMKGAAMFHRGELCAVCENSMAQGSGILNSGFRCAECKLLFHSKCLHSAGQVPCARTASTISMPGNQLAKTFSSPPTSVSTLELNPSRPPRSKHNRNNNKNNKQNLIEQKSQESIQYQRSHSLTSHQPTSSSNSNQNQSSSWLVTKTSEFVDPRDILITDCAELQIMDQFILKKIYEMDEQKRKSDKESVVDVIFKHALKEFRSNLISTYSVAAQDGHLHLTYKNLIDHFGQVILNVCQKEKTWKSFPVIMGVNAFRGYLDELQKLKRENKDIQLTDSQNQNKRSKKKSRKSRKNQNKKEEETFSKFGHEFVVSKANIHTVCEVCSSLMWLMEKIWVCKGCKLTCHKKCAANVTVSCRDKSLIQQGKRVFGAPIENLVTEDTRIPMIVDKLISAIEIKGLYTEGLYRKSGTTSKINELKQKMDDNSSLVDLDPYSVHVLTAALKSFFREMPEPLMTYDLYDDFLWSTAISDKQERVQAILSHIGKLPRANYDLLERLMFHLARVAQQEVANRMNANSLAIVFAPCILRTNKPMQMQDKLNDISKQTICIECIINERLKQVRDTLADIDILDSACHTASSRLSSLRLSKLHLNREPSHPSLRNSVNLNHNDDDEEEAILAQQIENLKSEKYHLTSMLPSFRMASAGSDEDLLSSTNELDSQNYGSSDEVSSSNLVSSIDLTALNQHENDEQKKLKHLTKNRAVLPVKRRPSRFGHQSHTQSTSTSGHCGSNHDFVAKFNDEDKPVLV